MAVVAPSRGAPPENPTQNKRGDAHRGARKVRAVADIILRVDEAPLVNEIKHRTHDVQHRVGVAPPSEKQRLGDGAGVDGDEGRDARGGSYGANPVLHLLRHDADGRLPSLVKSRRELVPQALGTRLCRRVEGPRDLPDALADAPPLDDALEALRAEILRGTTPSRRWRRRREELTYTEFARRGPGPPRRPRRRTSAWLR